MRLSVRSTIAVRLAYSPRWKFWNVSFGNGNVASRDSDRVSVGELADEAVEAVGGRDDVTGLVVEVCGEGVQLPNQPAQIVLTAGKRGAQRLGDVLNLAQSAAVEHQRQRCQRLLGAWVGATV